MLNYDKFRITKKVNQLTNVDEINQFIQNEGIEIFEKICPGIIKTDNWLIYAPLLIKDKKFRQYFLALKNSTEYCSLSKFADYKKFRLKNKYSANCLDYFKSLFPDDVAKQKFDDLHGSRPNVYDPIYIANRDNITIAEAKQQINDYKSDKSTSKENFIKKYGQEEGLKKFNEWMKKSLGINHDKELWMEINNATEEDWFIKTRSGSKRCKEYWMKQGYTEDEAYVEVSKHQKNSAGVHYDYYKNLGYDEEEILKILLAISIKKARGYDTRHTVESAFTVYQKKVAFYTRQQSIWLLDGYDKSKTLELTLDHQYSIKQGFDDNVAPEIIGDIVNLRFITQHENCSKGKKCSIELNELIKNYHKRRI
jgi:hypothetical protein